MIHLDFETRSIVDLRKCGAYRYASDASTEVLCLSWTSLENTNKVHTWFFGSPQLSILRLRELGNAIVNDSIVQGHNVEFEYAVWNLCFKNQIKSLCGVTLPPLKIKQLRCTAAKAATLTYPRALGDLCSALNTEVKKDELGKKIMLKLSKPRKPTIDNPAIWHESESDFKTLIQYNIDDVKAEQACAKKLPELSPTELQLFHATIEMNARGLPIDFYLVKVAHEFVNKFNIEKSTELQALTNNEVKTAKQVVKLKKHIALAGCELENLQEQTVIDTLKTKLPPKARRLLELRQLLAKSSVLKLKSMLDSLNTDNRVRGCQIFYGAHTGRWAGRGLQPHNFIKSKSKLIPDILHALEIGDYELFKAIFPDVHKAASFTLRAFIKTDRNFFDVDWSAIEARVILWLAGDTTGLKPYVEGRDPYRELAAIVLKKDILDVTDADRQGIGKPGVLSSGFGMGHKNLALQYNMDPLLAYRTIRTWRKIHEPVVKFWRTLQNIACDAIESPGQVYRAGNHIKFVLSHGRLLCFLPSKRPLYYLFPQVSYAWKNITIETPYKAPDGTTKIHTEIKRIKQRVPTHITYKGRVGFRRALHGGIWAENVTQATARDIVGESLLNLKGSEFKPILLLHDEILCETTSKNKKQFLYLINKTPAWCEGLPLATNFWSNNRFGAY